MSPASVAVSACPMCGEALAAAFSTPRLHVARCAGCGHRVAAHPVGEASPPDTDYHQQYDADGFLAALERTRRRQARLIVRLLARHGVRDALVDFGTGRGWMLDECRRSGFTHLAGMDTSELAVRLLRERGLEAHVLPFPGERGWGIGPERLSFRPRAASFLDVIEHFPVETAGELFASVLEQLGEELDVVLVKVPLSEGLFYRMAAGLRRLRAPGPIEQLYQCGTWPPHFHYFRASSVERLLRRVGLEVVELRTDRDFEPAQLAARVHALKRLPPALGTGVGAAVALAARLASLHDSGIFVARRLGRPAQGR